MRLVCAASPRRLAMSGAFTSIWPRAATKARAFSPSSSAQAASSALRAWTMRNIAGSRPKAMRPGPYGVPHSRAALSVRHHSIGEALSPRAKRSPMMARAKASAAGASRYAAGLISCSPLAASLLQGTSLPLEGGGLEWGSDPILDAA